MTGKLKFPLRTFARTKIAGTTATGRIFRGQWNIATGKIQDAPEAAADSQQNAPSAASLIVIAAAEMQDRTLAQEIAAGEPEAAERKKNGGGAGPPPQEKGEQGVNSGAAV